MNVLALGRRAPLGSQRPFWTAGRRRAVRDGLVVAGVILTAAQASFAVFGANDAHFYWATGRIPLGDLYRDYSPAGRGLGYSPAFAQLIAPITALPWPLFRGVWFCLAVAVLAWLAVPVPRYWKLPFVLLCLPEAVNGNIHLLLAGAIAAGTVLPATWAFVLLTKVTPGVGLLWHLARREWRPLAVAAGATLFVVIGSYALAPGLWAQWFGLLWANREAAGVTAIPQIPVMARLPLAALLVGWGGLTDRRWTIAAAATLALPHIVLTGLTVLAAIPRLQARRPKPAAGVP